MPGLVPGIHIFCCARSKAWMAGTGPAMTEFGFDRAGHRHFSSSCPGFVPGIHVFLCCARSKTWMAGTGPAMTEWEWARTTPSYDGEW
jgi:hypothetical protein